MEEQEVCVAPGPFDETAPPPYMIASPDVVPNVEPTSEAGSGPDADAARAELYAGQYGGVEVCSDPAQLPVIGALGGRHKWIRTPNVEAGQGPADDGRNLGLGTEITNHSGRSNGPEAECHSVDVPENYVLDQECVEGQLTSGRDTGIWAPWNTCNTVVDDILDYCTIPDQESPPPSTGGGGGPGTPEYNGGGGAGGSGGA